MPNDEPSTPAVIVFIAEEYETYETSHVRAVVGSFPACVEAVKAHIAEERISYDTWFIYEWAVGGDCLQTWRWSPSADVRHDGTEEDGSPPAPDFQDVAS